MHVDQPRTGYLHRWYRNVQTENCYPGLRMLEWSTTLKGSLGGATTNGRIDHQNTDTEFCLLWLETSSELLPSLYMYCRNSCKFCTLCYVKAVCCRTSRCTRTHARDYIIPSIKTMSTNRTAPLIEFTKR